MPAIAKIRLCNVSYENGAKRYNDQVFHFDGQNSAILLENGGGKTVFIQTVLQCIIPHIQMAERKIKDTLYLEQGPAHVAVEWIINDQPRRYGLTCVSLFMENGQLNSLKYTYEYSSTDENTLEEVPFKTEVERGIFRPSTRGEIGDYYQRMAKSNPYANVFSTIGDYTKHIENQFKIIPSEWKKVAVINSGEGNVDEFFNRCKTTQQLLNNLLIPVIEEAIEGENTTEFAKTFEKQRNHFKKNRILHDKIEQSKGVKEHIDQYVEVFKRYDLLLNKSKKVKGRASAILKLFEAEVTSIDQESGNLINRRNEIQEEEETYNNQKLSYQVHLTQSKMSEKEKAIDLLAEQMANLEQKRNKIGSRRQNIQLSKVKSSVKEITEDLFRLNNELEIENQNLPINDLQSKLKENSANIKGYYGYELELIRLEKVKQKNEYDELQKELFKLEQALELKKIKDVQIKEGIIKKGASIDLIKEQMDGYYDSLFDTQIGCHVDEYVEQWSCEKEKASKKLHHFEGQLSELINQKSLLSEEHETLLTQIKEKNQHKDAFELELNKINRLSRGIYDKLQTEGLNMSRKDPIYTREESILALLQEKIGYLNAKKSEIETRERELEIRGSFKEVVHPSLLNVFNKIKACVDFVVLGQAYMNQLVLSMKLSKSEILAIFPYFAMTYITNRGSKEEVIALVQQSAGDLSVPVFVITIEEMNRILQSGQGEAVNHSHVLLDSGVVPGLWSESVTEGYLEQHNMSIEEAVMEIGIERKQTEKKWLYMQHMLFEVEAFFNAYPYTTYQQLLGEQKDTLSAVLDMKDASIKEEEVLLDVDKETRQTENICKELAEEIEALQKNISIGITYEKAHKAYLELRKLEEDEQSKAGELSYGIKELEFNCKQLHKESLLHLEAFKEYTFEERKILNLELYKEIEGSETFCANVDIQTLINERESLKNRLMGLSISRDALVFKIKDQTKLLSHYLDQEARLEKEAEYPTLTIDIYYEHEEDDLFDQLVEIKKSKKELEVDIKKVEKERWALETECNLLMNDLIQKGRSLVEFDVDLQYIPTKLTIYHGTIRDMKRNIEREEKEYLTRRLSLQESITSMKIKDATYGFTLIEASGLSKSDKEQLSIQRDNALHVLFRELSENHTGLVQARSVVQDEKQGVLTYCKEQVDDFRLKEAITNGLMEKTEYNDLLVYQERMSEIIYKTIQLANDDKRESDTELMTFLSHLLTYVKTVIEEFHVLQKKTLIELGSTSKQIFVFDIPEYDEVNAKEALRLYVDQMIILFEEEKGMRSASLSTAAEMSDESIRQLIEERLSIKNLLPVVLLQQPIKVKCRKVTNDLKINKAPMSWEYSNKWSGGEKWSKNMTLFLGILNYLAEKKQHLSSTHKRNRTVILDNPFGKASSKHVLDPVFFIAEKLGFQIIALTAHAEGQFISDYFPVVYSLRLRDTNIDNKLLMTSERTLNYTYLKEKAPASVSRLQSVEQLNLLL